MVITEKRPFRFGAMVHQDYEDYALWLPELEDRLNVAIDLTKYTNKIERIYFVPMILSEINDHHEEESYYEEAEKKIFLRIQIDPLMVTGLEKEAFLQLVAGSFLKELKKLEVLPEELVIDLEKTLIPPTEEE